MLHTLQKNLLGRVLGGAEQALSVELGRTASLPIPDVAPVRRRRRGRLRLLL
jgi:hypothetical protein